MEQKRVNSQKRKYIIEMSWGCPSEQYPLNGIFQFDQARALMNIGEEVIYVAVDMRSFRKWRKWGINKRVLDEIEVYEYNFPFGPLFKNLRYHVEEKCFKKLISVIEEERGIPGCFHFHNCTMAIPAVKYCLKKKVPYIITEHSTPLKEGKRRERKKREAYKKAKYVVAVSKALSTQLTSEYGIEPVIVHNIVDLSQFEYKQPCVPHENFRFISAARVDSEKGFDTLLRAFATVLKKEPDCRLEIMGDGPYLKKIKDLAVNLGIADKVSFWGEYLRDDFSSELNQSDCFVLASKSETFGIVYIEAMACGIPVIATRCGGPEDFINTSNGILVPVDDVDALSSGMIDMKRHISDFNRKAISIDCRERFSSNRIAKKIEVLLKASVEQQVY